MNDAIRTASFRHHRTMHNYGPVSDVDGFDWVAPPEPKRKCEACPTLLSRYNLDTLCHVCLRKYDQPKGEQLQKRNAAR